jgi:hypothetical protein
LRRTGRRIDLLHDARHDRSHDDHDDADDRSDRNDRTPSEAPGYIDYHWHGQLFFEIDGELVDFDRPKYYLDNIEQERPETVYFHFHDSAHGPNE